MKQRRFNFTGFWLIIAVGIVGIVGCSKGDNGSTTPTATAYTTKTGTPLPPPAQNSGTVPKAQ